MKIFQLQQYRWVMVAIVLLFTAFPFVVDAASISFSSIQQPSVGSRFSLDVLVDTEGENINSIEGTVSFSPEEYRFEGYDNEGGVISLWVSTPREEEKGLVHFSGVIPGGIDRLYDPMHTEETSIPVTRLLFVPLQEGKSSFGVESAVLLKNDGKGTPLVPSAHTAEFLIAQKRPTISLQEDTTPPNPFVVEQITGSLFGKTPPLLLFNTTDEGSGIHHYEISINNRKFNIEESPFAVPTRLLPYRVTVRAFDFAGNIREEMLVLPGDTRATRVAFIAIVGVIVIVVYMYRRRSVVLK